MSAVRQRETLGIIGAVSPMRSYYTSYEVATILEMNITTVTGMLRRGIIAGSLATGPSGNKSKRSGWHVLPNDLMAYMRANKMLDVDQELPAPGSFPVKK